jgi:hypothetical protein
LHGVTSTGHERLVGQAVPLRLRGAFLAALSAA